MSKSKTKIVYDFNKAFPIGTEVIVRLDDGTEKKSAVCGEAYVLGDHTPCVFLEGISGAYLLARVRKAGVQS